MSKSSQNFLCTRSDGFEYAEDEEAVYIRAGRPAGHERDRM